MTTPSHGRRWRSVDRFVGALVAVVLLVVVAPTALIAVSRARFGGGSPFAGTQPPSKWSIDEIRQALTRPLDDEAVTDLLIRLALVVTWLAVAVIVATTIAELVHRWRHRGLGLPTVRGVRWAQPLAGFIASGLIVFASLGTPRVALSTAMPTSSARVALELDVTALDGVGEAAERRLAEPVAQVNEPANAIHVVVRGDSVYGIASRLASGDPVRTAEIADEILDLNLGQRMAGGMVFTNPAYIEVGWRLVLPTASSGDSVAGPEYVVEVGDTLSDIAERHLGDAGQWTRIWSVNAGVEMIGGRTFDDPDLILPGWRLTLPTRLDSTDTEPVVSDPVGEPAADSEVDVEVDVDVEGEFEVDVDVEGEFEADSAAEPTPAIVDDAGNDATGTATSTTPPATTTAATTTSTTPATTTAATTTSTTPATTTAATTTSPPATTTMATTTSTTAVTTVPIVDDRPGSDPVADGDPTGSPGPVRIEHAALLAAGVLSIVAIRRRLRLRSAVPRTRIPAPRPDGARIERRLRNVDVGERLVRVDIAIRAAAATMASTGAQVAVVVASADGAVALRTTTDTDLPSPWIGAGADWTLPGSTPIEVLAEDARKVAMPCVALAQVGVGEDGEDVLVDVEACGTLAVVADDPTTDAVVTAVAMSVAASPFAEVAHLVGASIPDAATLDHRSAHRVGSAAEAVELARELAGGVAAQDRSSFELRALRTGGEAWEPAVVFLTSADGEITDRVEPGRGVGIVRAAGSSVVPGGGCTLAVEDDRWTLDGFGVAIHLTPVGTTDEDLAAVAELLDDASAPPVEPSPAPVDDGSADEIAPPEHEIVVGVVGEVVVADRRGHPGTFERGKTVELIAWLATHRDRSTRTAARTALWELDVRDATFANVVSEARRGLARLVAPPEGEEWVARTLTESLPLHDLVVTDADLIEQRLAAARLEPPDRAIETLRPAVELVRGIPFSGTSYLWPDAEGITSSLVLLAMTACTELAAHALSVGNVETVFWATGRGLAVLPGHEELVGLRMRAHARAGDLAGVRQEWESYERVIVADAWSDGEPAPKLLDLRRELLS